LIVLAENGTTVPLIELQGRATITIGDYAGKDVKNKSHNEAETPEKT